VASTETNVEEMNPANIDNDEVLDERIRERAWMTVVAEL
jgi:hypothetical protein